MMLGQSHSGASGKGNDDDQDPLKKSPQLSGHEQESGEEHIFDAALAAVALQKAARALEKAPISDLGAIEHAMAQVLEIWQSCPALKALAILPLVPRPDHQLQGYKNVGQLIQKLTFSQESVCNLEAGQALTAAVGAILQSLYSGVDGPQLAALKKKVLEALKK